MRGVHVVLFEILDERRAKAIVPHAPDHRKRMRPVLAAATAWLAPLPPGMICKSSPLIVSPGLGERGVRTTRSALIEPQQGYQACANSTRFEFSFGCLGYFVAYNCWVLETHEKDLALHLLFLYFAAFAAALPFFVLFYQKLGFNGAQIGLLTGIPPLITLFASPFWTGLADARGWHKFVMGLGMVVSVIAVFFAAVLYKLCPRFCDDHPVQHFHFAGRLPGR